MENVWAGLSQHNLPALLRPRLWEMCCAILVGLSCGRSDARFPLWWVGSVSVGVPTIDYFGVGFEDVGGRSVLGEGRLPGSQAEKQSSKRF